MQRKCYSPLLSVIVLILYTTRDLQPNTKECDQMTHANEWKAGLYEAIPISISTFIFSAIFGVVAIQAGYSVIESTLFSVISFSGAAQLSILPLIGHISLWTIFCTTFLLNARHLLYGLTLAPHVQQQSVSKKGLIAFLLCDSMFALAAQQLRTGKQQPSYWIGAGITIYMAWCIGTWAGASFTELLPNGQTYGLEFAGTACFIILLAGELTTRIRFFTAIICILLVLICAPYLPSGLLLILAGALTFAIGFFSKEGAV